MKLIEVMNHKQGMIDFVQNTRQLKREGIISKGEKLDMRAVERKMYPLCRVPITLTGITTKIAELEAAQKAAWRDEDLQHIYDNLKEHRELLKDLQRLFR